MIVKTAAVVLSDEKARKRAGWLLAAALSPVIVVVALLLSLGTGTADQNNAVTRLCFLGGDLPEGISPEYRRYVQRMRDALDDLEEIVDDVNEQMENSLNETRVQAVFYALFFGADRLPVSRDFVDCFVGYEDTEEDSGDEEEDGDDGTEEDDGDEESAGAVPLPLDSAYENLAALLGREITEAERTNAARVYDLIAGPAGGGGGYLYGSDPSLELDISAFQDPTTKNAADLAAYATHAWESEWGYVWGTYGEVLTGALFAAKLAQYPEGVGNYRGFIAANWVGRRTTDCVGLIKGYGWLDPETMTIRYGTNGMPDVGADQMYRAAAVSGPISTIPEIPGLAVWHSGHIGVYIGNGEVIEAMGTRYGVVKTRLSDRHWARWLKIPYIRYD